MFRTRLISGIILVAIALVVLFAGGPLLAAVLAAVSVIGYFEFCRALKITDRGVSPLFVVGIIGTLGVYLLTFFEQTDWMVALLLATLILTMSVYVLTWPRYRVEQVTGAFFGVIYTGLMLSTVYQLRALPNGVFLVWLIFLASWGNDTCAYCVGMLIGKHKMAPELSPKKSVEGAVGGVVGAGLLGAVYALAIRSQLGEGMSLIWWFMLICIVGALISMIGDLAASAVKRNQGIKDFGKLIPGHGGILDRFDSVIFVAPVIYFLIRIAQIA